MIWFLTHWKQVLIGALFIVYTGFIWQVHSWFDAYRAQNTELKTIKDLGNGEAKIIKDDQKIHKVLLNENCATIAHSSAIGRLLY